jgi:hypothetical protein
MVVMIYHYDGITKFQTLQYVMSEEDKTDQPTATASTYPRVLPD